MRRLLVLMVLGGCGGQPHHHAAAPLPAEHGEALVERRCTTCHSDGPILRSVGTASDWDALVHRMAYHHKATLFSHLSDDEAAAIAHYLAETQPLDATGVRIGPRPSGRPL